ncbi:MULTISPECIES: hypothetical protein [unclassified Streptomyces]|uniref:hypothetical protein n=1 Tax=unclassified Streptomyces TaxID=2593676 RepID=UPI00131A2C4F|nr:MULTISPECIES: hypothetical protein [unclassified Streptomyces]MYY01240.1 hypothetical protein [Streptomyces sp. SID4913]
MTSRPQRTSARSEALKKVYGLQTPDIRRRPLEMLTLDPFLARRRAFAAKAAPGLPSMGAAGGNSDRSYRKIVGVRQVY